MEDKDMKKRSVLWLMALILGLPVLVRAQGSANFSGTWKLAQADPPVAPGGAGGGGGGGAPGGGGGSAYQDNLFSAAPATLVITQTATQITVQVGPEKEVYTLDDKLTVSPPDDVNALKTHAHWDGARLHLHYKKGMNFGRDIFSLSGGTLTVLRDLESGGGSTTRTLTYTKAS
jgi:hypothetical protein